MTELADIAALVQRESGIVIAPAQFPSLSAAVERVAPGLRPGVLLSVIDDHGKGGHLIERLIDEVTIKETFFFRHERELAAIEWRTLLDAARQAGRSGLRVWSAACATGEEAYTLAIMASEALGPAPPVSVLGTDISPSALERARRGEYSSRALREPIPRQRERWFAGDGPGLTVAPQLRELLRLRRHNLIRDPIPPSGEDKFDVIVCRNVLIYFDRGTVDRTLSALEGALYAEGMLVIGAADRLSGDLRRPSPLQRSIRQLRRAAPRARRAAAPPASDRRYRGARAGERDPEPPTPAVSADPRHDVLRGVDMWSLEETLEQANRLLERDPLNVDAYFVRGVAQLAARNPVDAVASLRRALYLDPDFGLAAFKLARAYEALHDMSAARRAYVRALHSLRPDDPRSVALMDQLDVADVAGACRTRLAALDGDYSQTTS